MLAVDARSAGPLLGPDDIDLLIPSSAAARRAIAAARAGEWLDAWLLATGCGQVLEDELHGSEQLLDRVAAHMAIDAVVPGAPARAVRAAATAPRRVREARPAHRSRRASRDAVIALSVDLAARARGIGSLSDDDLESAVVAELGPLVAREEDGGLLRLPSCFLSFDQHPEDVAALVRQIARRWPDRGCPLLVCGVRTSGSYLGALAAAELRARGFGAVELITVRPGERLDPSQRRAVARARGGRILVIDDPPATGTTVRDSVAALVAAGAPAPEVSLVLAVPDAWTPPPALARFDLVLLPAAGWHVARLLRTSWVRDAASRLLAERGMRVVGELEPTEILGAVGASEGPRSLRGHRRRAFTVTIEDEDRRRSVRTLLVQGVGLGYLGQHDARIAAHLGDHVPDVMGVADGLCLQLLASEPEPRHPPRPERAVAYLACRRDHLRLTTDRPSSLRGRKAAWEVAAMLVGASLKRGDLALRASVVEPLVHDLLRVQEPAVVDGRMTTDRWLTAADGHLVKVDFAEGAFSNEDLWSADLVRDVASIGDELRAPAETRRLWEEVVGRPVEASRWTLLRLVNAWDRHRHGALPQPAYGRRISGILAEHVGSTVLAGLDAPTEGPWCALDVDGVLETGVFSGGSAPGLCGATALRALLVHRHRVVLATGRSVAEVAERCRAWGLPGGVAEYGSGLVIDGEAVDLRTAEQRSVIEQVRDVLGSRPGCTVDPQYALSVRAWRTSGPGGRAPLRTQDLVDVWAAVGTGVMVLAGEGQTDIVATGLTKATGLLALLERLDPVAARSEWPLALAVGDGLPDVDMFGLAACSAAPAHAAAAVRGAASRPVAGHYQAGLRDAVAHVLGHVPGGCPICAPGLDLSEEALLRVLSLHEAGPPGVPARLRDLALAAGRARRARAGRRARR